MLYEKQRLQTGHCVDIIRVSIFDWQVQRGLVGENWWDVGKEVTLVVIYLYS